MLVKGTMRAKVERTLTTILCADVDGYSRLMGRDEVGTLETLKRHRAALAGLVERHHGRVVNTWGDGVIAAFPSVVEAVQCAVETQLELASRNEAIEPDRRLLFRIGINLGDVMVDGDDLYGDGVNVAARLQTLAEPGGIVISGTVYDHVRNKLTVGFDAAGLQDVKNIAEPVLAYRVRLAGAAAPQPRPRRWWRGKDGQPGPVRRTWLVALTWIGFLGLLDVFTGSHSMWFHYPALVILLIAVLQTLRRMR